MVGGQKFGCSYPSYCCVLPPDFKQAKFECLSEWCREAHTAVIRQVPFLHPFSNLGDTMISQLNRFKNLYSLPGYTAQIWVAFSWACQADLRVLLPCHQLEAPCSSSHMGRRGLLQHIWICWEMPGGCMPCSVLAIICAGDSELHEIITPIPFQSPFQDIPAWPAS